jgi:uncharacterized RDD family membrane protein YckC
MFCSRCGLRVEEGNRFCQACGQEVSAAVTATAAIAGAPRPPIAGTARVSAPLPYAGFWARFVAYLIDGLILGIPIGFVVLFIIMSGVLGVTLHRKSVNPHEAAALLGPLFLFFFLTFLVFVVMQWLYFVIMESSERQATVGKSVMSLRVTDYEGQRISFGHATGRFFAKIVSGLIPFAIGYIMAGFTEKKQALHDLIAGTLVLKK